MSTLVVSVITDGILSADVSEMIDDAVVALANYDQTTVTLEKSFGVSSITDVTAGQLDVNLTNTLSDTNLHRAALFTDAASNSVPWRWVRPPSTTTIRGLTYARTGSYRDNPRGMMTCRGVLA